MPSRQNRHRRVEERPRPNPGFGGIAGYIFLLRYLIEHFAPVWKVKSAGRMALQFIVVCWLEGRETAEWAADEIGSCCGILQVREATKWSFPAAFVALLHFLSRDKDARKDEFHEAEKLVGEVREYLTAKLRKPSARMRRGLERDMSLLLVAKATLEVDRGDYRLALRYAKEAVNMAWRGHHNDVWRLTLRLVGRSLEGLGKPESAMAIQKLVKGQPKLKGRLDPMLHPRLWGLEE